MKLPVDPRLPIADAVLARRLADLLTQIARQVNGVTEGRIAALHGAMTAPPATGLWAQGDRVLNAAPAVQGAAGSQYVVHGWVCVAGGEPGTWVEQRTPTGS